MGTSKAAITKYVVVLVFVVGKDVVVVVVPSAKARSEVIALAAVSSPRPTAPFFLMVRLRVRITRWGSDATLRQWTMDNLTSPVKVVIGLGEASDVGILDVMRM